MATPAKNHNWRFFRVGGFDQVKLETGADLLALDQLDQKLWVALSCPVEGLEFDARTLQLIDTDKDGRIRAPDVIAALTWAGSVLKSADTLVARATAVPLAAIDAEGEEGKRLLASAKQILADLGKKGQKEISVEDTADTAKIFAQTKFNGDGVIPPTSADDEATQKVIQEVIDCVGSEVDRSGAPGISQALLDRFFAEAEAFSAWWKAAESDAARVLPLGDATAAAVETWGAVRAKVDDYFARTRLVAFDARAAEPLNREVAEYAALAGKELGRDAPEVAAFPLAHVAAGRPLPLGAGVNPAWAQRVEKLAAEVVAPLLGERAELTDADWTALGLRFAPYEAWHAARAGAAVEKLGLARVRALLEDGTRDKLAELIARDKALELEASSIDSVDKLVRYCRDLAVLANNYVSFRDFYSRREKGIFQAGKLYIDGRSCALCLQVGDVAAHSAFAVQSGTFLVYCECTRKSTGDKKNIVAALTDGDADGLTVGRNGIFYDRKGTDWDATVVKIIEHPISVRQAFFTPYRLLARLVSQQAEKFAASRDKEMQEKAAVNVAEASKAVERPAPAAPPAAPPPPAFDIAKFAGVFAAIGLAVGAIGSALAAVLTGFLGLRWWQMPLALAGVALLISGPSMLFAWFKLRQRTLGPILDANGWAVNARARINIPFGRSLTELAKLPPNAERSLEDPFEEKRTTWVRYVIVLALLGGLAFAWKTGRLDAWIAALSTPPPATAPAPSGSAAAPPK